MAALPIPAPATEAPLRIRDLGPADEPLLDQLHAALSPRSQYQRFHGAKPRLSPRERRYLAATDGRDHVAIVALDDSGSPVAVGRFVRLPGRPEAADVAAEVTDTRQNGGIGTDLVQRLARRAAAVGICRFTATVLSETGLRRSLARRGWRVVEADGPSATLEIDVWALLRPR
ncbi:MAG TPA: GNAT family N-acetyltransferase [Solirubrobacteraceae bacterium]|nr:GNAT family N-acetyltransferase [Solirubrobacteraceae bacterium]